MTSCLIHTFIRPSVVVTVGSLHDAKHCWVCFSRALYLLGLFGWNGPKVQKTRIYVQGRWVRGKWEYTHDLDSNSHCEIAFITYVRRQAQRWSVWWFKVTLAFWLIVLSMHHRVIPGLSAPCHEKPSHQATIHVLLLLHHSRSNYNNYILWKFLAHRQCVNPLNPLVNNTVPAIEINRYGEEGVFFNHAQ